MIAVQEALQIAQAREEEVRTECHLLRGEAKAKVECVMELMKSQRLKLSQKFMQSKQHTDNLRVALAEARRSPNHGYDYYAVFASAYLIVQD